MAKVFLFNPYTGTPRHPSDIASDPAGLLIRDDDEPLRAAPQAQAAGQELPPLPPIDVGRENLYGYTSDQMRAYAHAALAQRQPLTDEQAKDLCRVGPIYAPDGVVTRTPTAYRQEIEAAGLSGLRKGERAHGIGGATTGREPGNGQ